MKFTISLTILALAVVVFASPLKRDVSTVETEILAMSNAADALDNDCTLFGTSPSVLTAALVTGDMTLLTTAVTTATAGVVTSATFTAADSRAIVSKITGLASHLDTALTKLMAVRPEFNALLEVPFIATTSTNLGLLQAALTAFETALSGKVQPAGTLALDFDSINNLLTAVINAFELNVGL